MSQYNIAFASMQGSKRDNPGPHHPVFFPSCGLAAAVFMAVTMWRNPISSKNDLTTESSGVIMVRVQGQLAQLVRAPR